MVVLRGMPESFMDRKSAAKASRLPQRENRRHHRLRTLA